MNEADSAYVVQKIQDFIERNMFQPITMKQLSNEAGYSSWYLARIFKEVTGTALYEYIRLRRLTQAFNPEIYGYKWATEKAPRFQLAPMGYQGYIEARPVERL